MSYQPRVPTQASVLLERFPAADGKGVTVAVFDTGVDPGAVALQRTSDGRPKVVDLVDATGAGDVDTSKVVQASSDDAGALTIAGLSGKTLTLNTSWANPTGAWRVGIKRIEEIFPRGLKPRSKADRAEVFDEAHDAATAAADHALAAFEAVNPGAAGAPAESALHLEHAELAARVKLLKDLGASLEDVGPIIDCVVWHDGEAWRAVLDREQSGDLSKQTPMTNFRAERQWALLVAEEKVQLNFAVNIYDAGAVLSIVTDSGAHGTHVAGTIGAFDAASPELNGVAPGVQIVGIKIGDNRLGSMETGTGMARAAIACVENGCDLVNMSFGEPSGLVGVQMGRITTLYKSLVQVRFVRTAPPQLVSSPRRRALRSRAQRSLSPPRPRTTWPHNPLTPHTPPLPPVGPRGNLRHLRGQRRARAFDRRRPRVFVQRLAALRRSVRLERLHFFCVLPFFCVLIFCCSFSLPHANTLKGTSRAG